MAVKISDGKSSELDVLINLEQFRLGAKEIEMTLARLKSDSIVFDIDGVEDLEGHLQILQNAYNLINAEQTRLNALYNNGVIGMGQYSNALDNLIEKQSQLGESINDVADTGNERFIKLGDSIASKAESSLIKVFSSLKAIKKLLPDFGIAGLLGFAVEPIINYLSTLELFKKKLVDTVDRQRLFADVSRDAGDQSAATIVKIDLLTRSISDVTSSEKERIGAINELRKIGPDYLSSFSDTEIMAGRASKAINQLKTDTVEMARAQAAFKRLTENQQKLLSNEYGSKNQSATEFQKMTRKQLDDELKIELNKATSYANAWGHKEGRLKDLSDEIDKRNASNKVLSEENVILGEVSKPSIVSPNTNVNRTVEAEKIGNEEKERARFENIERSRQRARELEEKYQGAVEKSKNILNSISSLSDEVNKKSISEEEQGKQAIIDKFSEARKELTDYNNLATEYNKKAPRSKHLEFIDPSQLDKLQTTAINANKYHYDTENLKIEVEKQKKIFEEYEQYKLDFGSQKADERYSADLKGFSSYADYLKSMLALNMTGSFGLPSNVVNERNSYLAASAGVADDEENKRRQKAYDEALLAASTLEENIDRIKREYAAKGIALGKDLTDERKAKLLEDRDNAIEAAQREAVKKQEIFSILYNDLDSYSKASALQRIADAKQEAESQLKSGKITEKVYKELIDLVNRSEQAVNNRFYEGLINMGQAIGQIGQSLSGANGEFGAFINGLGSLLSQVGNAQKLVSDFGKAKESEKFEAGTAVAVAGIGAAVSLIGIFTSSAKQRKQAEKEYYNSVLKSQKEYNLSLNEQIRLRSILDENVFVKDYKGRMTDGTTALTDANKKFLYSLEELQQGRAKVGKRSKVDSNSLLGGAAAGAVLGTIVPGVGNLVGGVVGGIVGAIAGLFGGKKKKDVFGGLLQEYPELIQKAADGTIKFNDALANNLIQNNLVDDKTKILLQNTTDLANARKEALEQINGVISDLSGNLGDNLRSSLVDAFREGEDSAKAFGNTVEGVLENIVSQMLFSAVFGDDLSTLQDEMKKSFDIDGDQSFVDDMIRFFDTAGGKISLFNNGLEEAQQQAEERGLNLFGKEEQDISALSSKTIQASLTEDTANRALGIWNGMFDINKRQLAGIEAFNVSLLAQQSIAMDGLRSWQAIEMNTANTVVRLDSAITELKAINKNTGGMSSRDMGV